MRVTKEIGDMGISSLPADTLIESRNNRVLAFNKQVNKRYSPIQHLVLRSRLAGQGDWGDGVDSYFLQSSNNRKQNAEEDTPIDIAPTTILKSMLNIWKLHPMDLLSYFRKFNNANRKINYVNRIT